VVVQFLEIHNQDINDLLCAPAPAEAIKKKKSGKICNLFPSSPCINFDQHGLITRSDIFQIYKSGS
jgi:hypothetical protein